MQFQAILEHIENSLGWGYHITVPDEVAQNFIQDKDRRVVCTINDTHEYQCALMPKGNGSYMILVNATNRKKLRVETGGELNVQIRKDESKYGLPMPEEFEELLLQDEDSNSLFHALTKGKQRNLLYIIGKPKGSAKRLEKAIVVAEHLKANNGKLDFKALNEAFKNYKPDF